MRLMKIFLVVFLFCLARSGYAALPIQHWKSPSGAEVYFVESHAIPMLDINVDFAAGSSRDPRDKAGLAALTQHLLDLGAGGMTEEEISKKFADVGALQSGHTNIDRVGLSLRTLASQRERNQAVALLAAILQAPAFPEAALEREKARVIAGIKEEETKPEAIAEKNFMSLLYGEHPYGLNATVESVSNIRQTDVAAFYRAHYRAERAVVAMMGDITRKQAEAIAEQLTSRLPARDGADIASLPQVVAPEKAEVKKIPHPATQSHILLGLPVLKRGDPDHFPLFVGNYILGGGGFVSRLNQQVREKRGFAYSVYSYFKPLSLEGPFEIGLQTKKEQTNEALQLVRATLAEFLAQGPTAQELKAAKQHLVGGFPLRIDSNRKIMDYLAVIGFYKLPLTWLDDFVPNVEKVTVADIRSAFARRVKPEHIVTVIVGAADAR